MNHVDIFLNGLLCSLFLIAALAVCALVGALILQIAESIETFKHFLLFIFCTGLFVVVIYLLGYATKGLGI